jgi:hypothetical protein
MCKCVCGSGGVNGPINCLRCVCMQPRLLSWAARAPEPLFVSVCACSPRARLCLLTQCERMCVRALRPAAYGERRGERGGALPAGAHDPYAVPAVAPVADQVPGHRGCNPGPVAQPCQADAVGAVALRRVRAPRPFLDTRTPLPLPCPRPRPGARFRCGRAWACMGVCGVQTLTGAGARNTRWRANAGPWCELRVSTAVLCAVHGTCGVPCVCLPCAVRAPRPGCSWTPSTRCGTCRS